MESSIAEFLMTCVRGAWCVCACVCVLCVCCMCACETLCVRACACVREGGGRVLVGGARGGRGHDERSLVRRKTLDVRLLREKWSPRLDEHLPECPQARPILCGNRQTQFLAVQSPRASVR